LAKQTGKRTEDAYAEETRTANGSNIAFVQIGDIFGVEIPRRRTRRSHGAQVVEAVLGSGEPVRQLNYAHRRAWERAQLIAPNIIFGNVAASSNKYLFFSLLIKLESVLLLYEKKNV
jgi:hypothetical protein